MLAHQSSEDKKHYEKELQELLKRLVYLGRKLTIFILAQER